MNRTCNICDAALGKPVYQSADNASITTMNKVIPGRTEVFFCGACGHLQTTELPNLDQYYASEYEINLSTDDDDQLYKVVDGRAVYRADHQAAVLIDKIPLSAGTRVLDYGCAKAATLRKILAARPHIVPMTFDVTDKYVPFWKKFVSDGNWATFHPRREWRGTLDVVLSFYALEHVSRPRDFLEEVRALLKPGGTFYLIVPNVQANIADFVVADHINHFSEPSLRAMLQRSGFEPIDIDIRSHDAAFVVTARAAAAVVASPPAPESILETGEAIGEMAAFWREAAANVQEFEQDLPPGTRRAIYGAGFYGNFIASSLRNPEDIECFVDQNTHLQGRKVRGKPIVAPAALAEDVQAVFVGLNPRTAESTIRSIECWNGRQLEFFFL